MQPRDIGGSESIRTAGRCRGHNRGKSAGKFEKAAKTEIEIFDLGGTTERKKELGEGSGVSLTKYVPGYDEAKGEKGKPEGAAERGRQRVKRESKRAT